LSHAPAAVNQAARVHDGGRRHPDQQMKESDVRSAREDKIRGDIDRMAGRVIEAFGKVTGDRSTRAKGRAARARGAGRSVKGRLKRHVQ
jgi:uncharacterized protein YjbJ (UPF0337 family)